MTNELALRWASVSHHERWEYWLNQPNNRGPSSQRWKTGFVRNQCRSLLACDSQPVVTAGFRQLYVFVLMEIGTRRLLLVQLNDVIRRPLGRCSSFVKAFLAITGTILIDDRDSIFSAELDGELKSFGLKVLRTPVRAPRANAYCERLIGTMRREFLDFVIPLGERHLRSLLKVWVAYYNQSRRHSSLGPGIPEPANLLPLPVAANIGCRRAPESWVAPCWADYTMSIDWRKLQPNPWR